MKKIKRWFRMRWYEHKSGYRLPGSLRKFILNNRPPEGFFCFGRASAKTVTLLIWTATWKGEVN